MGRKSEKKGKVSIEFLIIIIVLVVAFLIILFFFTVIPFNPIIDKETCHQSIVLRAAAGTVLDNFKDTVPLNCQTEKLCLTMSGDDCILSSTRYNPVRKIKLGSDPAKARQKIIETLAESMISCHATLGEGKLNFIPSDWVPSSLNLFAKPTAYGLICNRIVFDEETKEKVQTISYSSLYTHLGKKSVGDQSALEYLYPGWSKSRDSVNIFGLIQESGEGSNKDKEDIQNLNFKDWSMNLRDDKGFVIIAIEAPHNQGPALLKGSAVAAGIGAVTVAAIVVAPVGIFAGLTILTVGTAFGASAGSVIAWYSQNDEFDYSPPSIMPFNIEALKKLGVYSFEIAP